jgi:hypothetical protein
MRRENKIKVLAEVVEIGRFVTTAGVGGFIARLTPLRHPMEAQSRPEVERIHDADVRSTWGASVAARDGAISRAGAERRSGNAGGVRSKSSEANPVPIYGVTGSRVDTDVEQLLALRYHFTQLLSPHLS